MAKTELIFPFESPRIDHYDADAFIIWCFDDRFSALLEAYKKFRGFAHTDDVKVAGGGKDLGDSRWRDYLLGQFLASHKLHHTNRVIIMVHAKCGAYGLKLDETGEYDKLVRELEAFAGFMRRSTPGSITIETGIGDFDGFHSGTFKKAA